MEGQFVKNKMGKEFVLGHVNKAYCFCFLF